MHDTEHKHEETPFCCAPAVGPQGDSFQSIPGILGQWQRQGATGFSVDPDTRLLPVDIIQPQGHDIPGPQGKPGQ